MSVIIVSYNAEHFLRQCLESLYETVRGIAFETIVVDNCSSDGGIAMVKRDFPQVRVLENSTNMGFARGNNRGIALAQGEHVLLLNSDTRAIGGALGKLVDFLDTHPDVAVVAPRLVYPDLTDQCVARSFPTPANALFGRKSLLTRLFPANRYSQRYLTSRRHTSDEPFEVDWVSGACLMARKDVLDAAGRLDEAFFMYWEDLDLCYRVKQRGGRIVCVPEARVVHYEGKSSEGAVSGRCIIEFHKGVYRYYRKHHVRSAFDAMNVAAVIGLAVRAALLLGINSLKKIRHSASGKKSKWTVNMERGH